MYGQADLDLLKRRVLHHDKKSLERKNKKKATQTQQMGHLKKTELIKNGPHSSHTIMEISEVT